MSRSPYNIYKPGPKTPPSHKPHSAEAGAERGTPDDYWGHANGWGPRSPSQQAGQPRPPSDPNPPATSTNGKPTSIMAFRARKFGSSNSGQSSEGSPSPSLEPSTSGRKSANSVASNLQHNGSMSASSPAVLSGYAGNYIGSGATANGRPTTSSALSTYTNGGPLPSMGVSNSSGKPLRPKSTGTTPAGPQQPAVASGASSKVLKNRLSEEGHAAGTPTLSLREKVVALQKANKQLEQQLAEAQQAADRSAAEASAAAATAAAAELAALKAKLATMESDLTAAQRAAADLHSRNAVLTASQQQLQHQLSDLRKQPSLGDASIGRPPSAKANGLPPLGRERSQADLGKEPREDSSGPIGGGPASPRTPLGADLALGSHISPASLSPSSSSASSTSSSASYGGPNSSALTATGTNNLAANPIVMLPADVALDTSLRRRPSSPRLVEDSPFPHPYGHHHGPAGSGLGSAPSSPPATATGNGSSSSGGSSNSGSTGGSTCRPGVYASRQPNDDLPPSLQTEPLDAALFTATSIADPIMPPEPLRRSGSQLSASQVGPIGSLIDRHSSTTMPVSPAIAAGLSGAGVALLAKQRKQMALMRAQLQQKDSAYSFLANEHAELEGQLKEVEAAKREYAARYAFMLLDQDLDGHVRVDQVRSFEMFGCYANDVVEYAFKHWRFASGFKGYLNMDDFLRFVTLADDRTSKDSQRFWFCVMDLDGDGHIGPEDAKWFYDAVEKDETTFVVSFEDLWHQMVDMTQPAKPRAGFTAAELFKCKLGAGVLGLLLNHNNMLLHRTTAEWGRGDFPL